MPGNFEFDNKNGSDQSKQQPAEEQSKPKTSTEEFTRFGYKKATKENLGAAGGTSFSGSYTDGITEQYATIMKEYIEQNAHKLPQYDISIRLMTKEEHNIYYSAIVYIQRLKHHNVVFYYTYMVEGSNTPHADYERMIGGERVVIPCDVSLAYNDLMAEKITRIVTTAIPNAKSYHNSGATYIPASVSVEDKERVAKIVAIGSDAIAEANTKMFPSENSLFDYTVIKSNDSKLQANFNYSEDVVYSRTGVPRRSDIIIDLFSVKNTNRNIDLDISSFQHSNNNHILRVGSYVDLIPTGLIRGTNFVTPGAPPPKLFTPNVNITSVANMNSFVPFSSELFLMGIVVATLQLNSYAWAVPYENKSNTKHDIGAVGYLTTPWSDPNAQGGLIDTSTNSFTAKEMGELLYAYVEPTDAAITIDVEDLGPDTWLTSLLTEVAAGKQGATNYLLDAANYLTNGVFESKFDRTKPICSVTGYITMGTYNDGGVVKDIRDIDLLAVLNALGHNGQEEIMAWCETFYNNAVDPYVRLQARWKMIKEITHGSAKSSGRAKRVQFSSAFINALIDATNDSQVNIDRASIRTFNGGGFSYDPNFMSNYWVNANIGSTIGSNVVGGGGSFSYHVPTRWS